MSPIGRIFLILNLILSAVFLGWASNVLATSQDYKGRAEAAEASLETTQAELEEQISELNTQLAAEEAAKSKFREERDQALSRAQAAESSLVTAKNEAAELRGSVDAATSQLGDYNSRLETIASAQERAIEEARTMERERNAAQQAATEAERAKRDAEEQMASLQQELASAEIQVTELSRTLAEAESRIQQYVTEFGATVDDPVAKIDGAVLGVRADLGLVALNVGTNNGVTRGMTFDVFRGSQYKGEVRVVDVEANRCSAVVDDPSRAAGIARGDNATTQL